MSAHCHKPSDRETRPERTAEFFPGATLWPADLSRREFLQLMGASLALAGLTACGRPTQEKIVPYVMPPEMSPSPDVAWYATAMPWQGFARGVLARSIHGRPVKLEGNPDHPESLGATDAVTQAAILSLYDPDRSAAPRRAGQVATWDLFEREWIERLPEIQNRRGAGLALLTEPTTSPTELREIHALLDAWPEARWFQHTALPRFESGGEQPDYDFAAADVVLSVGSDFLFHHPAALRHARAFASRRRVENGEIRLNRFFAIEPTLTLTGAQADLRLPAAPSTMPILLNALSQLIDGGGISGSLNATHRTFIDALAAQLRDRSKVAICVVGEEMPLELQQWSRAFNHRFGGKAVNYFPALRSDADTSSHGGLTELMRAIDAGKISGLCILGPNPVYTAPAEVEMAAAIRRVAWTVALGPHADETAQNCLWHLPQSHFLETWSDLRGYAGAATLLQPLVEPLHASRSIAEILRFLRTEERVSAYDLVRETWHNEGATDFDTHWHAWLNRGVIDEPESSRRRSLSSAATNVWPVLSEEVPPSGMTVLFRSDSNVSDGRWANNAWLQELPRPFTALVWENAALIDSALAKKMELQNGDVITCESNGRTLDAPVWIIPGQASDCITLALGYGRTHGEIARGRGFSAYPLRTVANAWQLPGVAVHRAGRSHTLVSTQEHFTMEGRDLARVAKETDLSRQPDSQKPASFFPSWPREGYAWGMSIDLSTCFGCNACVVACQAENNIPVVGRDQVGRGREMHWIRIDRYYSDDSAQPRVVHQPVPCMHCENAPCEVVCPVGATVHTSEGLNDMIYNRCVGTRYCSNNCPYKVRRFNFLDYRAPAGSPVYLQTNPDVTVRERGVMEKCTYCVQRINAGRIAAEKENRRVRDGEIRTACQQACPAEAIVFGDLNDPQSRVVQRKREAVSYALLGELGTRPRTTYLAKIVSDDASATSTLPA